jgi:hypothetical protein
MKFFHLSRAGRLTRLCLFAGSIALGFSAIASAQNVCMIKAQMLEGKYVFAGRGYNIVAGVAQPKAIVEVINFNGDGTLSVPAATVSINGFVAQAPAGGTGTYTVESSCAGTLTFANGPRFDIFVSTKGDKIWMIQTNPNTVLQGEATKQ